MATRGSQSSKARLALVGPVARGIGLLLHIPALMAAISLAVAFFFEEWAAFQAFIATMATSLVCGQILFWGAHGQKPTLRRHAMLIAALAWLAVSAVGSLPFILQGTTAVDGLFESLSGFTSTGMSVLDAHADPRSLQWWRSLSEWVGGVGVIVLLLSVMPPGQGALELYYSETRDQKLLPNVRSTAQAIWSIYLVYTLLAIGLLWLGGAPLWQALNHGMTAIATGGFAITEDSLQSANATLKLLYMPIMIAGAISFYAHYRAVAERQPRHALFGSSEQRLFLAIVLLGAAGLAFSSHLQYQTPWVDSVLQWVSAVTTTGFQSVDLRAWYPGTLFIVALFFMAGGTAGSTAGGLKMTRVVMLYKTLVWELADVARRPREILRFTLDGQAITRRQAESRIRATTTLIYAWFVTSALGIVIFAQFVPDQTPLEHTLFDVFAMISNTGLSSGLVGPDLSPGGKITAMVLMWMGRLEILPVMVLIAMTAQTAARGRDA